MRLEKCFKNITQKIKVFFVFETLFFLHCNLYGPEPGDPAFPAPIDPGDSAAVRAILDSNNLKKVDVRQAIGKYEHGRIHYFYLDSLELSSFAFTNDFKNLDSLNSIDLSANKITTIKVIDSIKFNQLYTLNLSNNLLSLFPIDVLKLSGISTIYIEFNNISSIPQELIASGNKRVFLDYNKLCSINDTSILAWLDTIYGNNWKSRQNCP